MSTSTSVEQAATRPPERGELLLEVKGLQRYFPVTRGIIFQKQTGAVKAVDGIDLTIATGETRRRRRRIGLREDDHRPAGDQAGRAHRRARSCSRARTSPT